MAVGLGGFWRDVVMAKLRYMLSQHLPGGPEGTVQTPVMMAGFLSKIQNRHLLHTSKTHYSLYPAWWLIICISSFIQCEYALSEQCHISNLSCVFIHLYFLLVIMFRLKHLEECKLYIFPKLLVCRYFTNQNCDIIVEGFILYFSCTEDIEAGLICWRNY